MMDYTVERQKMFSGQAMAESKKYKKFIGKSGNTWLVAIQTDKASDIYVTNNPENSGGEGFGGAHLSMELEDGTIFVLKGGWHANPDSLLEDTGYDCRDKNMTFVVISKERSVDKNYRTVMKDVLYIDSTPTLGFFNRGDWLAQKIANDLNIKVCVHSESAGSSSCKFVNPKNEL